MARIQFRTVHCLFSGYMRLQIECGPKLYVTWLIWNNSSPPKVKLFTWLAWKGRVKTTVFLQRIGVLSNNVCTNCVFCRDGLESVNHILLLCPFVWSSFKFQKLEGQIWSSIRSALLWSCVEK